MNKASNKPAAGNAGIASRLTIGVTGAGSVSQDVGNKAPKKTRAGVSSEPRLKTSSLSAMKPHILTASLVLAATTLFAQMATSINRSEATMTASEPAAVGSGQP